MLPFKEIDRLMWEILKFLWSCPKVGKEHPYRLKRIGEIQAHVIESLATGQNIILRDADGKIELYIAYWRVSENDLRLVEQKIAPDIRWAGDKIYVCEFGNKGGRDTINRMLDEMMKVGKGQTGIFWHSWRRGKFMAFPNKRGAECQY